MPEIKKYSSVRRFGARYGRRLKERFGKIDTAQRKKQKCPYCSALKAKRLAVGIWKCGRCNAKFTGKAYSVTKKITTKEEPKEEIKERGIRDSPISSSKEAEEPKKEEVVKNG